MEKHYFPEGGQQENIKPALSVGRKELLAAKNSSWFEIVEKHLNSFELEVRGIFLKIKKGGKLTSQEQVRFDKARDQFWREKFNTPFNFRQGVFGGGKAPEKVSATDKKPDLKKQTGLRQETNASIELKENFKKYILYEDDDILVLNKPAGVAVQSSGETDIVGILKFVRPEANIVHRIDKETSGVLILGKSKDARRILHEQFKKKEDLEKNYLAVVLGDIPEHMEEMGVIAPLHTKGGRSRVDFEKGKHAQTLYKKLQTIERGGRKFSVISVRIFTGKTHQIRVHLAEMGFPIVGDKKYGGGSLTKRFFLHAEKLKIKHPKSGEKMTFIASTPNDIREFISEE